MLQKAVMTLAVVVVCASSARGLEIQGVTVPETFPAGEHELVLNGAGVRSKIAFLKLYVGALFLQDKESSAEAVIQADEPMAVRLHIISRLITSERMEEATREGFVKATGGDLSGIEDRVESFIAVFKQDEIVEDDVFDLVYLPGQGVETYKNNEFISVTPGLDFKKALFGIWLSDDPVQGSLKEAMLSQ
jgi:hypothetical protein